MSRARELAKVGGKNQQIIAGLSSHVGVSTFAEDVFMYSDLEVQGTTTFSGGTLTLGNANTDNVVFGGEVDSNIIPDDDGAYDLGSSSKEWKDLFIDGTAHIDTLDVDANAGIIGDLTVTGTATFNTALANSNLANSSVSYGGVSLSLGGSDSTPAFDLQDATGYPTSSLTGTITNAQLAGSIANDKLAGSIANGKLANSTVSYGGISLSLGGSDATPAFDLTDATNYPTSSLTGTITNTQLAGSIANSKLSNSSITIGSDSIALGGSRTDINGLTSLDVDNVTIDGNTVTTSSGNLTIDSNGGTTTIADNAVISGNLTVNGTTTTINSTTVAIDDKNFQVATGAADDAAADGAGLTVDSGDGDKTFNFEATGDNWGASENLNLASGKVYKINNSSILSATTLGSSVVSSSLTSVGTLGSLAVTNNITVGGTVDGRDLATDGSKLDGIEASATADQTAAEIRTLVGSASDSNVFTDADHSKLDGIESGATADQTASEILTLIKTVDGSGSGLDADLLDGISSASFLRSDTSDSMAGTLTMGGNILPDANGTRNLGASGTRWANVYTSDLDMSNQAKGGNSIDGSWGSYLIEEGEDDLFLTNRRSGKKYKFLLQEI